jgi:hypothetical protein
MIARTEISFAHNRGTLEGYKQAKENADIHVMKEWMVDPVEPCDICLDNRDDGPIDLDEDFSSGDSEPPAHPNCECTLVAVVPEEDAPADDGEGDDEQGDSADEDASAADDAGDDEA